MKQEEIQKLINESARNVVTTLEVALTEWHADIRSLQRQITALKERMDQLQLELDEISERLDVFK